MNGREPRHSNERGHLTLGLLSPSFSMAPSQEASTQQPLTSQ